MIGMMRAAARHPAMVAGAALLLALALTALTGPAGAEGLPVIDFISPGGVVSDEYVLNVTVVGDLAAGRVYYGLDGAEPVIQMTHTYLYNWEAVIDTSGMSEGEHTVTVQAFNTTGANVTRVQTLTVDHTDPVVSITSSAPEYVTGVYTVTADVSDGNVDPNGVHLVVDGNSSMSYPMDMAGGHFECTLDTAADLMCGPHTLAVFAIDLGGNQAWSEDVEVRVDNQGPEVEFASSGGHVQGIYQLNVNVTDAYMDPGKVWAVFDGDTLNRTKLNTAGGGVYTYSFDTTTMADGDTEITVLATDLVGFTAESDPLTLMVDNNPPVSRITTEGGNVSGILTVEATVTDAYLNDACVYLVVDGDDDNSTMMDPVDGKGRYQLVLDTRDLMDGLRELRVYAEDMWGMYSRSPNITVDVDNYAPTITFTSGGGTRWGTYRVKAMVYDAHLDTSCVMLKVGNEAPVAMRFSNDEWYYDVKTLEHSDGPLNLVVTACDTRGNENPGATMTITIQNQADLEVVSVEWVSTEVEEGAVAKVKVGVRNNGHAVAKDYLVVLTMGGKTLASEQEVTGIQPGKVHSYTLKWKAEGTGDKIVRVGVDPANAVPESDETNNQWDQQTLSVASGGSSTPGMGAITAALAVLGAAYLVALRRQ